MTTYTVHDLTSYSMEEAYDFTQYSDTVKDGDVLIVPDGFAIMYKAWPTMALGDSSVFHTVEPTLGDIGTTWMKFTLTSWPMVDYHQRWDDVTSNPEKVRAAAISTVEACEAWDRCGNPTLGA